MALQGHKLVNFEHCDWHFCGYIVLEFRSVVFVCVFLSFSPCDHRNLSCELCRVEG